ncbi:MAG TPA: hypothetical protein VNV87_00430 [Acidimicrobiales bacterium]|nr:hypothetical protein [Acidimicrobiales bacterium]
MRKYLQRNVLKKCSILSAGLAATIVVAFTIGIGIAVRKFDSAPVQPIASSAGGTRSGRKRVPLTR